MKKLVSILLAIVILTSVCCVTAFAESTEVPNDFLYQDKFEEFIGISRYSDELKETLVPYYYDYDELYYHENEYSDEVDWVLVRALTTMPTHPWDVVEVKRIGNRVIKWLHPGIWVLPFSFAVYNASDDRFYDISIINPDDYNGIDKAFEELGLGHAIGDVDMDGDISITDATEIQLYLAKEKEIPYGYYSYIPELSDVDENGDMTILDVTAIQLHLAGLDNESEINEDMVMVTYIDPLGTMPEEATSLSFEQKYSAQQFLHCVYKNSVPSYGDNFVIIKSNEQYNSLFNEEAPVFEDEFFESKWLVASFVHTGCYEAHAPITEIAKAGDTLYVSATPYIPDFNGSVSPIDPFWLTIVSVDKAELASITNIIPVW